MTNSKILLSALALAIASSSFAQTESAPVATSAGLLGQRYVAVSGLTEDFRNAGGLDNAFGGAIGVNLPLTANLDLGFGYGYERLSDGGIKFREQLISASVTPYVNVAQNLKLFANAAVSYAWAKETVLGVTDKDNEGFWLLGVGAELSLGARTALMGQVAYDDTFDGHGEGAWAFSVGVNHWFTQKVGATAGVTFVEDDAIVYQLGVAFRF
jgi:hypothetical protein